MYQPRSASESIRSIDRGQYLHPRQYRSVLHGKKPNNKKGKSTSELICLQNFQKYQILITRVLDIMTIRLWEIAHVTSAVIERGRCRRRCEQRRTGLALDEERPLVTSRMPVDLTHAAGFHGHDGGGKVGGDGESDGVDNFHGATSDFMGWLFGEVV